MPMVGLGGSAGGIQPLLSFFQSMPADSGMAFVVILHLSPDHESTLPALIQRVTSMPTLQVQDTVKAQPNCIYIIPPGKALASTDGQLRVRDLHPERGTRVAIDLFFRSLADSHGPRSAVIVLSGADSDGALGIKRIKEMGGLTIAQEPDEAEHTSMPRAAIQTGMVDWVLPVAQMPARLLSYFRIADRLKLPPEEGPPPELPASPAPSEAEAALREVLAFLRTRTGRDFSYYKRATILRRIARRMQVNGVDDLPGYLTQLRTHPGEAGALLQDLLISVTNFFRDHDACDALALHIPALFRNKGPNACVRAWVPGCASGEEAYSIAMLLAEHARTLDAPPALQVFATDLDEEAIATARTGAYPFTIATDVSDERLRRFFIMDHRGYRVRQELRETVLFACHDLLRDSPFSHMDLVSCRNLLIYLNRDAQARAFDTFAFALWPQGRLFLGSSESIDDDSQLFSVVDQKHRIYLHRSISRPIIPVSNGQGLLARSLQVQNQMREHPLLARPPLPGRLPILALPQLPAADNDRLSLGELHLKLIERLSPPSLVVNKEYDIVHLSESAGRFLQFSAGELKRNLLALVNPTMRIELRAALFQASQIQAPVDIHRVPVDIEGRPSSVDIRVRPAPDLAPDFLLVTFDSTGIAEVSPEPPLILKPEVENLTHNLECEIDAIKSQLRQTLEESGASTEELKASNEELQAMNEELRSATEELETSREELQSINEELSTVNQELKCKLNELSQANSDLHNLMVSTAIPTIFLNRELRIMRYTPGAVPIFNLISTDLGRPLSDLKHRLQYPSLEEDARHVLLHISPVEREIADIQDGRWFLSRLLPYRTMEDEVAGVVLTLVDITESKRSAAALQSSETDLAAELKASKLIMQQLEHSRVELWESLVENERVCAQLAAAAEAKDNFLAVLSHELRTPLTPVLMATGILARRADLPPDLSDTVEMIRRNIRIEAQLIDDLLDVTRIERGKLEIVSEPVDLHAVIRHAITVTEAELQAKKQPLTVELNAARHQVLGDPTRLQQVMWNLLKNASKFSPDETPIRVATWNEDNRVLVSVSDQGIGIDPASLQLIFDPFRQENRDVTRTFGGLGLGLAIARATVDAHGGKLRAESPGQGAGATFIVDLPLPA